MDNVMEVESYEGEREVDIGTWEGQWEVVNTFRFRDPPNTNNLAIMPQREYPRPTTLLSKHTSAVWSYVICANFRKT
jgi:hypothetical protein